MGMCVSERTHVRSVVIELQQVHCFDWCENMFASLELPPPNIPKTLTPNTRGHSEASPKMISLRLPSGAVRLSPRGPIIPCVRRVGGWVDGLGGWMDE